MKDIFSIVTLARVAACSLLLTAGCGKGQKPVPVSDFTFVQASDVHAPMAQSRTTIARIIGLGAMDLAPFNVPVAKPDFVLVSGDLTEFGGGSGWWDEYLSYWKDCSVPVHHQLGNHDNTWRANIKSLRDLGAAPWYSFERHGCHFVCLMSATPQDPRPSIGEEQILWLRQDLKNVSDRTPVFVVLHHPLGGAEFASRYDYERLLDELRQRNTVLVMAGHSHGHVHRAIHGVDQLTGGSTFGPNAGFAVLAVQDRVLRAAYWKNGQPAPDLKLLEKTIPEKTPFPRVELATPAARSVVGGALAIAATLSGAAVTNAAYAIDDELKGELSLSGAGTAWKAQGRVDVSALTPGAHNLRVEFSAGAARFTRSTQFFHEPAGQPTAWRAYLGASSKVTPTVADGVVYVGANDGRLHAFAARTGKPLWSVATGAEILAQPLVAGDQVICANGLGLVAAFTKRGEQRWSFTAGDAVYSSPVLVDGKVVFGCNDGKLHALEAATGKPVWTNSDAGYAIESAPFVAGGKIYFGAWDQHVRCVSAADGKLIWQRQGEGSRQAKAAHRYYSPGDARPVVAGNKLFVADRSYALSILDAETGEPVGSAAKAAATGLAEDGRGVYVRRTDGDLARLDDSGQTLWSVPAHLGPIPAAPTEHNGVVYVASARGLVTALSAAAGSVLWQYQASPQLFVMSSVACDGTNAYVTAFDGTLTAIKCRP